jgi:hypothetical protein
VKDETGDQGHTFASLLHQSAMCHCSVNIHCFYKSAFSTSCFVLSVMDGKINQHIFLKFLVKLSKSATETLEMLHDAFEDHSFSWIAVFE